MRQFLTDEQSNAYYELEEKFVECDRNKDFNQAAKHLIDAWESLPETKVNYSESYFVAAYSIDTYIHLQQLDNAKIWAEKIFSCAPHRKDTGEKEYMAGKIAYEAGNFNEAKRLFQLVQDKSKGRIFRDGDVKYFTFFKKK